MSKAPLLALLILAFILRFYKLGEIPLSLNWDETSNAYNAYSILKTGRDEYRNFLPLANRSFDDFKPPLYMYLNVPTVAVFDLTPFAARLPSALFGALTVALVYFLVKKLFENELVALLSAFLLTVSSWHLQFSRVGFEANIGLFFIVAYFTCLIYALSFRERKTFEKTLLIISALVFGLGFYSYHAFRIFAPIMLAVTFIIFSKDYLKFPKKYLLASLLILIIIVLPILVLTPREAITKRLEVISYTSKSKDLERSVNYITQDEIVKSPAANLIHNRRLVFAQTYLKNYLLHFDINFLFIRGDENPRHHAENMGMLYLFQLPLVLIGLYLMIKEHTKVHLFIILWFLIAPVPAIFSEAAPHAVRSLNMVIPLSIISAYTIVYLFSKKEIILKLFLFFTILISFFIYLENYWKHYPLYSSSYWQYGYFQAVIESERFQDQFKKINVSGNFEQAYIFWLFASKYNPANYQKVGSRDHFDNFFFNQEPPEDPEELYVNFSNNLPSNFKILKTVPLASGQTITFGRPKTLEELLQL